MPPGLLLYGVGVVCLAVFAVREARDDRRDLPTASGWLLLGLGAACIVGGTAKLVAVLFGG
jgi:hypothetical protein